MSNANHLQQTQLSPSAISHLDEFAVWLHKARFQEEGKGSQRYVDPDLSKEIEPLLTELGIHSLLESAHTWIVYSLLNCEGGDSADVELISCCATRESSKSDGEAKTESSNSGVAYDESSKVDRSNISVESFPLEDAATGKVGVLACYMNQSCIQALPFLLKTWRGNES